MRLVCTGILQVVILLSGKRLVGRNLESILVLGDNLRVDVHLRGSECRSGNKLQVGVGNQLASEPEEGLLEVVVGLGTDIVVLEVLLAVEGDVLRLHLTLLDVNLVSGQNNGDVFADADQVTVPVGNVFVCDARGDIEHDDGALPLNVVTIAETTELLLASCVPGVEANGTEVGVELQGVNFDTKGSDVFLLELSSQVTLDEGGLTRSSVTDKDELEGGNLLFGHCVDLSGIGWTDV